MHHLALFARLYIGIVFDGAVIAEMVKPGATKSFREHAR